MIFRLIVQTIIIAQTLSNGKEGDTIVIN